MIQQLRSKTSPRPTRATNRQPWVMKLYPNFGFLLGVFLGPNATPRGFRSSVGPPIHPTVRCRHLPSKPPWWSSTQCRRPLPCWRLPGAGQSLRLRCAKRSLWKGPQLSQDAQNAEQRIPLAAVEKQNLLRILDEKAESELAKHNAGPGGVLWINHSNSSADTPGRFKDGLDCERKWKNLK